MTNPNNAIGTNGAFGGRTSVNAFNDNLAIYTSRGILSGFAVSPDSGMKVVVGGDGTTRDVAIAEDNIGNKTTINNISESPVSITIDGAPVSNSRIDAIVAYVDNPAQGSATETDNPSACGLIAVKGTVSASPSAPDENAIRTAITADGASGTTAYYVVLGYITVGAGTTDITSNMIEQGSSVEMGAKLPPASVDSNELDWSTIETITTNSNGTAIKYQNGIMVCYKVYASGTLTTDATYGITTWTYPVAFIEDPCVQVNSTRESNGYSLLIPRLNNISSVSYQTTWTKITSSSTTPGITSTTLNTVCYYAIGKWK